MGCTVHDATSVLSCYDAFAEAMTPAVGQADYPDLPVKLPALATQAAAVRTADSNVGKTADAASIRDGACKTLFGSLKLDMIYCETRLAGLSHDDALARAHRSGFDIHGVGTHDKPILEATQASPGAPVQLAANKTKLMGEENIKKAVTFHWRGRQVAADNEPAHPWTQYASTPKPATPVPNLPAMTNMEFEVAVTFDDAQHPWTGSAKLPVH